MSDILKEDIEGPPGLCHTVLAPGQDGSGEVLEGHGPGERAVELVDVSSGPRHGFLDAAGEAVDAEPEAVVGGLELLGDDPQHGQSARLHLPGEKSSGPAREGPAPRGCSGHRRGYLCLARRSDLVSFGLRQAPVHPQLMELLPPLQQLLADLLFHRFNLIGETRGKVVLQAVLHTGTSSSLPGKDPR